MSLETLSNIQVYHVNTYNIPLTKPEIEALDMVLRAATKSDFGSDENNDIVYSLYRKFSGYRREVERENQK